MRSRVGYDSTESHENYNNGGIQVLELLDRLGCTRQKRGTPSHHRDEEDEVVAVDLASNARSDQALRDLQL